MKKVLKYYIVAFMLIADFVAFAQPGDEAGGGGLEGGWKKLKKHLLH
jgi:hypothetical protein